MANEWNITKEELLDSTAEAFAGEDRGGNDENKIVPIVNKGSSAESGAVTAPAEPAAQAAASIIAAQADQIAVRSAEPNIQPAAQPTSRDVQDTAQSAGLNEPVATQPAGLNKPVASRPAGLNEPAAAPVPQAAGQPAMQNVQAIQTAQATQAARTADNSIAVSAVTAGDNSSGPDAQTAPDASDTGTKPEPERRRRRKTASYTEEFDDDLDDEDEERPRKRFFRFRSGNDEESRDKMILSRIKDEDLMEYLALEQRRLEFLQQAKEAKEKRILIAFQLLISLAAIVAITYLLQDNPTILISILYIVGIVAALNVWKNPHDKGRKR
ncbi:MAG: hypothetical protein K1W22_04060 [Lachnospiraceae bacterium]